MRPMGLPGMGPSPMMRSARVPLSTSAQPKLAGSSLAARPMRLVAKRPGHLLMLREATATEQLEATKVVEQHSNGNGNGNGSHPLTQDDKVVAAINSINSIAASNGNGSSSSNGHSNGKPPVPSPPPVMASTVAAVAPAAPAATNGAAKTPATTAASASNGNGSSSNGSSNGKGSVPRSAPIPPPSKTVSLTESLDMAVDPATAGQIETIAATAGPRLANGDASAAAQNAEIARLAAEAKEAAERRATRSASGTPYVNPGGKWAKFKSYSTLQIWSFAIQFGFKYFLLNQKWTYKKEDGGMTKEAVSARKKELAIWLREELVKLGPTFIKIGQQFSTRVDVLSPEFIKELEKLQDNVPPFDTETAQDIIRSSLGKPVNEIFEEFSAEPIAAASLGQVHLAKINGETVVVKVQRPGLKELFDIDLKNVRALAVWLQKADPKTDGAARDWVAIYDECSRILYQEIDYRLEGKNADQFRANFAGVDWVRVPKIFWEYSSAEVLVLEYVPGTKINDGEALDRQGLDRKKLARLAVESYLQQILRHGFFHADPHPGNVAVDKEGRLIYYDFGMCGSIPSTVKTGLQSLFYGVYNRDPDACLVALTQMGVYVPTGDKTAVRRTAEFFLNSFQERLDTQKKERESKGDEYEKSFKPQRTKDEAKERRKAILSTIGEDLLLAANDQPFRFPATFTFVVRAFTVLDGIGKTLDPRFDISEISAPYARELLLEGNPVVAKYGADLKKRFDNQSRAVVNLFRGPNKIEDVANIMNRLEKGELKLRVRALEAERALGRLEAWQRLIASALAASLLVNVGTVLSVSALSVGATASFMGAGMFALMTIKGWLTVSKLEKKEKQLLGTA